MESVLFKIGPSWTHLENETPLAHKVIEAATSAPDPNAYFNKAYQRGFTDGRFHLLKSDNGSFKFPTGLFWDVVAELDKNDVKWEVTQYPKEVSLVPKLWVPEEITLRDYQEDAVVKALSSGRGILSVPVNGGKSYIAVVLCHSFNVPTIVLVSRAEAVKQMYELFSSVFGEDCVATDVDQGKTIVIMTYTSGAKRDLSQYKLLIADEVHRVGAETFNKAVMTCDTAYYRFGLSGTPLGREDGKDIHFIGATGPIIYKLEQQFLVDEGYSASAEIVMIETVGSSTLSTTNWHKIEAEALVDWPDRNEKIFVVTEQAIECGKPTLIMVKRLVHGELIQNYFRQGGIDIPFTHGKLDQVTRLKYYNQFKEGKLPAIIASSIYDDSIDIPHIEVLINAAGGKSQISTKQKLGRGLRNPGDKQLVVVDFYDRHHRILRKHSDKRKKNYESEGFQVSIISGVSKIF
jgi:superfamily II DNA or RNA helicase